MILVDANLLLYAKISDYPQHIRTRLWLEAQINGNARVGLPWPSLLAFVRIATNPRVFEQPLSVHDAWGQVREWLDLPKIWIPSPTHQHAEILGELLLTTGSAGNLVPDVHLAALAIEHGLTLCSSDGDFGRFPRLQWRNPLLAE